MPFAAFDGRDKKLLDVKIFIAYAIMLAAQLCLTLCKPVDYSPPGSSVHGILQARILECVATPSSRRSSWSRDPTQVSCIAGRSFTIWAIGMCYRNIVYSFTQGPIKKYALRDFSQTQVGRKTWLPPRCSFSSFFGLIIREDRTHTPRGWRHNPEKYEHNFCFMLKLNMDV